MEPKTEQDPTDAAWTSGPQRCQNIPAIERSRQRAANEAAMTVNPRQASDDAARMARGPDTSVIAMAPKAVQAPDYAKEATRE